MRRRTRSESVINVLEVIQRATNALGIPKPSIALASTDVQVIQLVELLNQECRSLSTRYDWQELKFEQTFTTVATESQGTLSSIITGGRELRYILNETIWNRTRREPVYGPRSPRTWQGYKAVDITSPYSEYRIRGNQLLFLPAPTAGDTCAFEYMTKSTFSNAAGTVYYRNANADTDLFLLDDEIILAGLEWRWRQKKGLEYAEDMMTYERMVADATGRNGTKRTLALDGGLAYTDSIPQAIPRLIGS